MEEAEENFIGEEDPYGGVQNLGPSQQLGIGSNHPLGNQFNRKIPRNVAPKLRQLEEQKSSEAF